MTITVKKIPDDIAISLATNGAPPRKGGPPKRSHSKDIAEMCSHRQACGAGSASKHVRKFMGS